MRPFQNRIKYFEMRIVGLCFLSSRPLPVLPPCVWAEEPGGHPWHPYRAPLAKSPNRSVPRAPHPSEGSPSCLLTSQFFEKEPVSDQKQFEQREVLLSYGRRNCSRSTDGAYGKREKKDWERRVLADEFLGFSFAPFARCSPL